MHIPDGYLSPASCVTLYGLSSVSWYSALKRIKRNIASRTIPLISVFAAFTFVIMMFNLPLPGGTTGHATGVAIATIVLGPAASIIAVSIALALQALLFGDGGISTLGANTFNMAVVGSLVAYALYHAIAGSSEITSRRRILAAAVAGYLSCNAAALVAGFELGIQPTLYHDPSGAPLYAPYPLRIALPAIMIGHLTIAGLAEAVVTAGIVSYLQRADLGLFNHAQVALPAFPSKGSGASRLWLMVAVLALLTPLGVLAVGKAWGEWSASDFENQQARAEIARTSRQVEPPPTPSGIRKLSGLWTAPFPDYAPAFIKNPIFGYVLSAMFGVGVLASASAAVDRILRRKPKGELES
jgi:cobalt/nickel transport system permease protein